ncbi:MAG: serine protease [Flavobacteriales bacterium]|jgi:serine protease
MSKIFTILFMLVAFTSIAQKESPYVPGELLVQISADADPAQIAQDLSVIDGVETSIEASKILSKHSRIWKFTFDADAFQSRDVKSVFWQHPGVEIVQYNHYVTLRETPNDPDYGSQWHHNDFTDNDIDSEEAWDITTGGTTAFGDEIVVCVIEGGNLNHVDLEGNKWVNEGEIPDDGIDNDGNGYIDDYDGWNVGNNDDSGVFNGAHGTQVMGMIGAKGNNDLGVAGVNWDVKIMSVAGENIGSEASVISAYDYAMNMRMIYNETGGAQGAFVVATNASWGIDNGDASTIPLWCGFYDTLGENGILNCGATANNNVNIDVVGDIPTACASDYMISVTATNSGDVRTFSGYGATTIDLGAPGEAVWTTQGTNGYGSTSGTSFASPLTAGAIALIYSTPCPSFMALVQGDPQAGADYVRQMLFDGTDAVSNLEGECVTGGRLNVNNSINLILNACSDSDCLTPFSLAVTPDNGNYNVTWGSLNSMIGFNVQYREIGAAEWTSIEGLTDPSHTITDLIWCTEYEVQVMALCEESESEWSNSVIFTSEGCCENPDLETIVVSDVTNSTATVTWENMLAAESYNIEFSFVGGISETFTGITDNTFSFDDLEDCTFYTIMIQVVCADETLSFTEEVTFNTVGCGACADLDFCVTGSDDVSEEWIERVELQAIDNTSDAGDNGYTDYTNSPDITTELDPGGTYNVTFTPGFDGFSYEEYFVAWIDLNQNGTFEDSEIVFDSEGGSEEVVVGQISIPVTAPAGSARMRVSMKYVGGFGGGEGPTSCEVFDFGEVEDYCVTITENVVDNVTENGGVAWNVYPNPASGIVNISIAAGNYVIELTDLTGRTVLQQTSNGSTQLSLNGISNGIYLVRLFEGAQLLGVQKIVVN